MQGCLGAVDSRGSLWSPPTRVALSSQLQSLEQEKGRWRVEKAQLEQSVEENKERMEKLEGYWGEAQSLCQAVDEHLRETQAQYQALERKYSKAKRLIKDYQQKYVRSLGVGPRPVERPSVVVPTPAVPQLRREARNTVRGHRNGVPHTGPRGLGKACVSLDQSHTIHPNPPSVPRLSPGRLSS